MLKWDINNGIIKQNLQMVKDYYIFSFLFSYFSKWNQKMKEKRKIKENLLSETISSEKLINYEINNNNNSNMLNSQINSSKLVLHKIQKWIPQNCKIIFISDKIIEKEF